MNDVRFPTALQIMLTLANAQRAGDPLVTSTQLARGVGSTPSLVRRLLAALGRDGLVRATLGKDGGVRLGRPATDVRLGEIYSAVAGDKPLFPGRAGVPHLCDVSARVESYFDAVAADATAAVVAALDARTLEESLDELLALKRGVRRRTRAKRPPPGSAASHSG